MKKSSLIIFVIFVVIIASIPRWTRAMELKDVVLVGAAYGTHLFLHDYGHRVVAEEVGADPPKMHFFGVKHGALYTVLFAYKSSMPEESKLPLAAGGYWMEGYTFEFALQSYHLEPTTYNKALMVFSCVNFLAYTWLANYAHPESNMYDPNLIRTEIGLSKGAMLSFVTTKTALNAYRIFNPKAKLIPWIRLDKTSAALMIGIQF